MLLSCELACARAAIPVWLKTDSRDRFAMVDGMSAAMMLFSAAVRFVTSVVITAVASCKRTTEAPIEPRSLATVWMAVLMAVRAVCASLALRRSVFTGGVALDAKPRLVADRTPTVFVIVLVELASDRKMDVVLAVKTDVPL